MSWFGRTEKAEKAKADEQKRLQDEKYASERDWLEKASNADLRERFSAVWEVFDATKSYAHRGTDAAAERNAHSERLQPVFNDLQAEWFNVDRSNLSLVDAHTMFVTLNDFLPTLAGSYRQNSAINTMHAALYGFSNGSSGKEMVMHKKLSVLYQLSVRTAEVAMISHNQWSKEYASSFPKVKLRVPQIFWRDSEVHAAVEGLHKLWVKADQKALGDTDRFFVDEVAGRYFPDAWKLFRSFDGGDEGLLSEARVGFLEQVGLMGRRLALITEVSKVHALEEIEAQTSFLREVTARG